MSLADTLWLTPMKKIIGCISLISMIEHTLIDLRKPTTKWRLTPKLGPPKWSKHFAWVPLRLHSGKWIWLRRYYLETQEIQTVIDELRTTLKRRYTVNEASMLMIVGPLPQHPTAKIASKWIKE